MALVRWDPFRELEEMSDRLNRVFARPAVHTNGTGKENMTVADWTPSVDISETDSEYLIKAELPGVWAVLDAESFDFVGPLVARPALERSPYAPRPWLDTFRSGPVARFRPEVKDVESWTLEVADSRGRTVSIERSSTAAIRVSASSRRAKRISTCCKRSRISAWTPRARPRSASSCSRSA